MESFKDLKNQLAKIMNDLGFKPESVLITYGTIIITFNNLAEPGILKAKLAQVGETEWKITKDGEKWLLSWHQ